MKKKSILALGLVAALSACAPEAPTPAPTGQPTLGGGDSTKNDNTKEQ